MEPKVISASAPMPTAPAGQSEKAQRPQNLKKARFFAALSMTNNELNSPA
jgi:hypothetical protein